jgi:ABC-type spermidine/putrescine transport system permease subunit I
MDFYNKLYIILVLFAFTLLINLPFGYARARAKRYSLRWFLYIHVPIPVIFIVRTISHIDIKYIPIFAFAAITGQLLGGKLEF